MAEYLSTREVAEYLRIGERKVYELLRSRRIPASRVAGRWLFPRALVDLWVLAGTEGGTGVAVQAPPPVIAGSHDPLLEWATRESRCGLALMFDGSLDGLARVAAREALACGMHVADGEGGFNLHEVRRVALPAAVVVIEWAWREQGLLLPAGNLARVRGVADLAGGRLRVVRRQVGAGSRVLLDRLLAAAGVDGQTVRFTDTPARSESDVALAVLSGGADAGLGIRPSPAAAVEFLPLARERFDLVVPRREYFEPAMQRLLAFTAGAAFAEHAARLGGYQASGCGTVHWNSPLP